MVGMPSSNMRIWVSLLTRSLFRIGMLTAHLANVDKLWAQYALQDLYVVVTYEPLDYRSENEG